MGGDAWSERCTFEADLLSVTGGTEVVVLPTAAAFEAPAKAVARLRDRFGALGASVVDLPVLGRSDAEEPAHAEVVRAARFVCLPGGSPLHLRSVLKGSAVWEALVAAWDAGAVIAGDGTAASALCDPMLDPRGGAFTVGLGLVTGVAVLPHAEADVAEHHKRTIELAGDATALVTVPDCTALVRGPDGRWRVLGDGAVRVFVGGAEVTLDALPA